MEGVYIEETIGGDCMIGESLILKSISDAVILAWKNRKQKKVETAMAKEMSEAIRQCLLAQPDEAVIEAAIARANAAGLSSVDLILAQKKFAKIQSFQRTSKFAAPKMAVAPRKVAASKKAAAAKKAAAPKRASPPKKS